ncbi:hypothetical protein BEWA_018610 [Theileria equi strain WA]|uniref:Uncharacterized protein n=1 Tax=Theileria equi strain WA TaxID=1537102 RepID=L0AVG9_THEEQ|nr:hypothetical protein BEWA_018610 [Theileria equi strain WA]AFZ79016.1 hypothetical protein BEWA_018610 [Theileria equi strain WA]|eukprot:XP_004828682.1 hypothetical protein BEWA_018610 [Theileria equi strain WA]
MEKEDREGKQSEDLEPSRCNPTDVYDKHKYETSATEFVIEQMLYVLGGYILAPSPLPSDAINLWSCKDIEKTQSCEYCSCDRSEIAFPQVSVELFDRRIVFVSTKRACKDCYDILNLKKIKSAVENTLIGNPEGFERIRAQFAKVNRIENKEKVIQDLISIATSLNLILRYQYVLYQ